MIGKLPILWDKITREQVIIPKNSNAGFIGY